MLVFVSLTYRKRSAFVGSLSKLMICFKSRFKCSCFSPFPNVRSCLPFQTQCLSPFPQRSNKKYIKIQKIQMSV